MPQYLQDILLAPLGALLYAGSLAFWPAYRLRHREGPRSRSLFVVFVVHVTLLLAWTGLEVIWAFQGGDWLHGLVIYICLNVVFLVVYLVVWRLGRAGRGTGVPEPE